MAEIGIIIPTYHRAHLIQPLLANIAAVTVAPYTVYLVIEATDVETLAVARCVNGGARVDVIGDHGRRMTKATNDGFRATIEPYVLLANDDVRFHPGWDTFALAKMCDGVKVVGINQGNGRTDCFFLVDRSYVDDGGDIYSTEYVSQYPDTEFADIARERGVYDSSIDALIEHVHWTFGKSPIDENYRKALSSFEDDRATYERRKAAREAVA